MSELTRANTDTAFALIRDLDKLVRAQEVMLRQLVVTISSLEARVRQAEAALTAYKITNLGCGPTEKS